MAAKSFIVQAPREKMQICFQMKSWIEKKELFLLQSKTVISWRRKPTILAEFFWLFSKLKKNNIFDSIRKDCFQVKSKFITDVSSPKHMNITILN